MSKGASTFSIADRVKRRLDLETIVDLVHSSYLGKLGNWWPKKKKQL